MKLIRLVDPRLNDIINNLSSQKLPLKTAFKLKGIIAAVRAEQTKYEEVRMDALRKYANKDENGEMIVVNGAADLSQEGGQEFARELSELSNTDVTVSSISIADLGDRVELTTDELTILDELVTE